VNENKNAKGLSNLINMDRYKHMKEFDEYKKSVKNSEHVNEKLTHFIPTESMKSKHFADLLKDSSLDGICCLRSAINHSNHRLLCVKSGLKNADINMLDDIPSLDKLKNNLE